ncbi:hypothetical protein FRB96_006685 [Tulasnella sp. 330]|nr:hypothetical protein FRB96_006685 [Tulasnella sp. 330]KAG8883256.1 hypothetical protein FRB97_006951 [Tulasnella sp. 331]KAG8888654.1 hypothetical protein FRB98_007215 [Tulasnella sp. 332]
MQRLLSLGASLLSTVVIAQTIIATTNTQTSRDTITLHYLDAVGAGDNTGLGPVLVLGNNAGNDRQISYSSLELMVDESADGRNQVMDLASYSPGIVLLGGLSCTFPQSLVPGSYHTAF